MSDLGRFLQEDYKEDIIRKLNEPSIMVQLVEKEEARKERILRECLEPWRLMLFDRIKWRPFRRFLVRDFLIVEKTGLNKDRLFLTVWKGGKILKVEDTPIKKVRFVRRQ